MWRSGFSGRPEDCWDAESSLLNRPKVSNHNFQEPARQHSGATDIVSGKQNVDETVRKVGMPTGQAVPLGLQQAKGTLENPGDLLSEEPHQIREGVTTSGSVDANSPNGPGARIGRPPQWTESRSRRLARLYMYTTLPVEKIIKTIFPKDNVKYDVRKAAALSAPFRM